MSDITDKVQKLLAKAEGTDNEHERDAFLAHAHRLIEKHQLDAELLAKADPTKREKVVFQKLFSNAKGQRLIKAKREMIKFLADLHGCTAVVHGHNGRDGMTVVGHESDVELIMIMFNSIMLQLQTSLAAAQNAREVVGASGPVSYAHGYVRRVGARLWAAKADAMDDTATDGSSKALVLADRSAVVQASVANMWPKLHHRNTMRTRLNDGSAYVAGARDGDRADLGGTRIESTGDRRAIG